MKFSRMENEKLWIELDKYELGEMLDMMQYRPNSKLRSDLDKIIFTYYRTLEKKQPS
ncbi:hypothetical protein WMZ97_03290 [Lentibacillus sp. N15]|uniref:hypothetical protein n=1 Tax=Lentibacillus songyuanensis TaxID=3136161 RepID=UPI0031BA4528